VRTERLDSPVHSGPTGPERREPTAAAYRMEIPPRPGMKVAIVESDFSPDVADRLRPLPPTIQPIVYGHTRRLRTYNSYADAQPPTGVPSRTLRPVELTSRGPLVWFFKDLADALAVDKPDVIHLHSEPWQLVLLQALVWSRQRQTAVVVHTADRNFNTAPNVQRNLRRLVMSYSIPRVDGYIGQSNAAVREAFREGLASDVPTGVAVLPRDASVFRPATNNDERRATRQRLGLPATGVGVGFIGRFSEEKGPGQFLDAVDRLGDRDVWIAMAGSGPMEPSVRRRLESPGRFFLGALTYPSEAAAFYRCLDVLVVPSQRTPTAEEQSARAISEGMLSANLVVASNVGSNPEMLGSTGIVVEQSVASIEVGIRQALERVPGGAVTSAARRRAVELFSTEAVARTLADVWTRAYEHRLSSLCS